MENKKFCKFCGKEIDKDLMICPKCGRQLKVVKKEEVEEKAKKDEQPTVQDSPKFYTQVWFMWVMLIFFAPVGIFLIWKFHPEMKKNTKIIITVIFAILFLIAVVNTGDTTNNTAINNNSNDSSTNETQSSNSSEKEKEETNTNSKSTKKQLTLGDTFTFDNLELTLDKTYSFVTLKNQFSEHNGASVIKIGVNVKNTSSEKHSLNMFYYEMFGSKGTELDNVSSYFDNNIDFAGDLKPGASYKTNFYLLYDGDGKYSIDFEKLFEEKSVEFEIKK